MGDVEKGITEFIPHIQKCCALATRYGRGILHSRQQNRASRRNKKAKAKHEKNMDAREAGGAYISGRR
jgi:hypothetical protein